MNTYDLDWICKVLSLLSMSWEGLVEVSSMAADGDVCICAASLFS